MEKVVALQEVYEMAKEADGVNKIYVHWSAGRYGQFFDDYHINIDSDGSIVVTTDDLSEVLAHTWHRNTGAVGIALSCCFGAEANNGYDAEFGDYPPTPAQIDVVSQVVAVLCKGREIPVDYDHVKTHCEAAEEDGYGPSTTCERWDLWYLPDSPGDGQMKPGGDVIRGKAAWWLNRLQVE